MTLSPVLALPAASKHGTPKNFGECRSCGLHVLWVVTPSGKRMSVDPQSDDSHFANCPQVDEWRIR